VIFLHPLVLLGLAAAAVPTLLHLFQRRTPPEADFPPLRYLSEAERRSARRLRLRHLLLLALRTALIVVIVLAGARPLIHTATPGGAHPPAALAMVLDNSLSSGAVVNGQVTLDRLKGAARSVLGRAAPADRLWLMLADGVLRAGSRAELLAAVDSAPVESRRLDLVGAVREAARVVESEPVAVREVHVISDLQRSSLGEGRVEPAAGVRVVALAPAPRAPENRGLASARVTETGVVVAVSGTPDARAVPVTLRLGGRDLARALAAPGATLTLPFVSPGPGWWTAELELEPDELRGDDRRVVVWHTIPPARVTAIRSAGPFVSAALSVLRAGRRVSDGSEVTIGDDLGASASVVFPPEDPALIGDLNRRLAGRGVGWRFGRPGAPGRLESVSIPDLAGIAITRRSQLLGAPGGRGDSAAVLVSANGEPWAVASGGVVLLGSRLDTAWTALPTSPAFVPFLDAVLNRFVRGETPVVEREGAPRVEFARTGPDTIGATVYGPDPRESDLTPADPAMVRDALGAEVLPPRDFQSAAFAGPGRADLSGLLLVLALLLAVAELGVATLTR
jgi:hypothetical protein